MSANPAADERRQRLRDQMKAFYGDPSASAKRAASQAAAQGNSNVPPELDLDSEYFNVNRYTTDLLKRESLKGLVETDTDLLRRVRKLDGELQELVYRNYARFISATDTIREMKDSVVEMDAKLQTLSQNVNTIDGISSQISQQLQVHRSHIEETITANRMLKKVQFLTSLPTTMRRLIDKEEFNVGVKYWVAGDGFLAKHSSIASITQIQQSCCKLAGELYHAIEQRMCSYPLDDPDAMDRIRGYVEDLRLLRATSLFESAHMADQPPFEEAVLQTLMQSVMASFRANVATTQRSLKAALDIPENIKEMDTARHEASLAQVNLREPLAQLKNACAMLAVNSERVYALLDVSSSSADASSAATQVARDIQPVLVEMLQPLAQSLIEFGLAHLDAIVMDGGSAMRDPAGSAGALQSATTHLARLMKQYVTAMKTLAEIYLSPLGSGGAATPRNDNSNSSSNINKAVSNRGGAAAAMGSPLTTDNAVQRYTTAVHDAARSVLQRCYEYMHAKITEAPEAAVLKACVPLPVANTSVVSALPPTDENHLQQLAFVHTRLLCAALSQCTSGAVRSLLVGAEDGLPMEVVADLIVGFERVAQQLQHRAIVLLGQLEVRSVYTAAFSGSSSSNGTDATAAASGTPAVSAALMQVLPEWSTVYDVLKVLPTVPAATTTISTSSGAGRGAGYSGSVGGLQAGSLTMRRRETATSFMTSSAGGSGGGAGSGYRAGGYGGGGGNSSSNGDPSDHRWASTHNAGSAHARSSGKLAVAYTRQVMSALQLSVSNIFTNTETMLRTEPPAGPPSAIMACVVRYVLQGIVDNVRDEVTYTEAQFQRLQVSCTFLLYALLSPAKGTAPRQWRKEWSDDDMTHVQRLLDEACTCAYEKYEAKVPLAATVLDKLIEAAVRGGRAALAAGATTPPPAAGVTINNNTDSVNTVTAAVGPMPPVATVDFSDEAALPIPVALQRTANTNINNINNNNALAATSACAAHSEAPSPTRHDDPLKSPQESSSSHTVAMVPNDEHASASRVSSRPFAPTAAPPPPPAAAPSPAPPAPVAPAAALPKISAPPTSSPRQNLASTAAAPKPAPPPTPAPVPIPAPSVPAAATTGAQYYSAGGSERVARIDDEEELPM
jgi:vacuolar protein sorting-associated protein 51